jgi:hypothetical protein
VLLKGVSEPRPFKSTPPVLFCEDFVTRTYFKNGPFCYTERMIKIFDNKIWKDGARIGWVDGSHIRNLEDVKLGYFENNYIYNMEARKVAYIYENEMRYENGESSVDLERINEMIEGNFPILTKCAVKVLLDL